ncbi:MAG: hypothetical protein GOU97_01000, partial [Nanoarchaeota archaeon]|nr:hypothetical protein [Nanoarchaeota archaeon]
MKRLTILLSVFALTQLLFIGFYDYVGWDEAAYIMTGRYYWGEKVYYEVLRPPLYPLFLGFMEKILLMQAVPPLFALLLSLSVYSVGKKFFDKKTGLFAGILVYFAPLVVNWSPKFMTAIPASAFLMLAVSSQDRKKVLLPAIFFTA